MKKKLLSICLLLFVSVSLFSQVVPEVQRSLITKRSATWCPPCGGWGWTMFDNLIDQNPENAVLFAAHHSGDLTSQAAVDITANWVAFSQPRFYLGHEDQNASSSNATSLLASIKTEVDFAFTQSPVANVGFFHDYDGGNINVDAKVKFFQNTSGEFYVAFYLVENEIVNYQASQGNNAIHERVLRSSFTNDTFGELIANGDLNAGDTFDYNFSIAASNPAIINYDIVGIIWQKVDEKYQVLNVIDDEQQEVTSTREALLSQVNMQINPNISQSNTTLYLESTEKMSEMKIAVYDLNGNLVEQLFAGNLESGKHQFSIFNSTNPVAGNYFVSLSAEGSTISKKLVIQK